MGIEAEETIKEEPIDLQALADAENQEDNQKDAGEELQLSDTEQKAFDQGWRPKDDFEGPEDNWKSAKEYVRDGKFLETIKGLQEQIDSQKTDFDQRLNNTNKLHEARRLKEISDLEDEMLNAVRTSDTDAYKDAKDKKTELEGEDSEETTTAAPTDPDVAAWELKNPWINDKADERTPVAQGIWNQFINKNPAASNAQALAHVDERMGKLYAVNNDNPRRNQQNTNETPAKRGKRGSKALTMGDLTQSEKNDWAQFGQAMFKTEAAYLKAVKDTRAA